MNRLWIDCEFRDFRLLHVSDCLHLSRACRRVICEAFVGSSPKTASKFVMAGTYRRSLRSSLWKPENLVNRISDRSQNTQKTVLVLLPQAVHSCKCHTTVAWPLTWTKIIELNLETSRFAYQGVWLNGTYSAIGGLTPKDSHKRTTRYSLRGTHFEFQKFRLSATGALSQFSESHRNHRLNQVNLLPFQSFKVLRFVFGTKKKLIFQFVCTTWSETWILH